MDSDHASNTASDQCLYRVSLSTVKFTRLDSECLTCRQDITSLSGVRLPNNSLMTKSRMDSCMHVMALEYNLTSRLQPVTPSLHSSRVTKPHVLVVCFINTQLPCRTTYYASLTDAAEKSQTGLYAHVTYYAHVQLPDGSRHTLLDQHHKGFCLCILGWLSSSCRAVSVACWDAVKTTSLS